MKALSRTVALLCFSVLCNGISYGQQGNKPLPRTENKPSQAEKEKDALITPQRPAEIVNLVNEASAAPPEFAADALIRLAASGKVKDTAWRREMLEEAFRLAPKSENKVKRTYAGTVMDTREGYLSLALAQKLDALSLQSRSVMAMLMVDKHRAREMFSEISPDLKVPSLTCSDALIPDVSEVYLAMTKVTQEAFTVADIREGAALWFVQRYVEAAKSPSQVGPIVKAIASLKLPAPQMAILVRSFIDALKRVPGDYRTFLSAAYRDSFNKSFAELVELCEQLEIPTHDLVESLRDFFIRNFAEIQCTDVQVLQSKGVPGFVAVANRDILKATPISVDEIRGAGVGEATRTSLFWQSPKSKDLLNKLRRLRFRPDDQPWSNAEKTTETWHRQLTDFLNQLEGWSASDEQTEVDYFHEKAILYRVLSDILPEGMMRDGIWRANATFLAEEYLPRNRIEWFMHAEHFLNRVNSLKGKSRTDLLGIFKSSSNPILRTYACLYDVTLN